MSPRPPRVRRPALSAQPVGRRVQRAVDRAVDRAVAQSPAHLGPVVGRSRHLVDQVSSRLLGRAREPRSFDGWSTEDYLVRARAAGTTNGTSVPRRAGREAALQINALAGVLPAEAITLARAITDAAPPPGASIDPTLHDLLERYLPESLQAFGNERQAGSAANAQALLLAQLQFLHQVSVDVRRAQSHQDNHELQVQEAFLRQRFPHIAAGHLHLPADDAPTTAETYPSSLPRNPVGPSAYAGRALTPAPAQSVRSHVHLEVRTDPVVVFDGLRAIDRYLSLRLAVPRGHPATLGLTWEEQGGQIGFTSVRHRALLSRIAPRRVRPHQADLLYRLDIASMRRFLVYARSSARAAPPTPAVLFARDGRGRTAELSTMLTNDQRAPVTVIASGYRTPAGWVVRNESTLYADQRSAVSGFGYNSVTWMDGDTPIV